MDEMHYSGAQMQLHNLDKSSFYKRRRYESQYLHLFSKSPCTGNAVSVIDALALQLLALFFGF